MRLKKFAAGFIAAVVMLVGLPVVPAWAGGTYTTLSKAEVEYLPVGKIAVTEVGIGTAAQVAERYKLIKGASEEMATAIATHWAKNGGDTMYVIVNVPKNESISSNYWGVQFEKTESGTAKKTAIFSANDLDAAQEDTEGNKELILIFDASYLTTGKNFDWTSGGGYYSAVAGEYTITPATATSENISSGGTIIEDGAGAANFKISSGEGNSSPYSVEYKPFEYTMTIDSSISGGSLEVYDRENAIRSTSKVAEGTELKIVPTPESGNVVKALSVTAGSDQIYVNDDGTFTMPGSDVTVSATFEQAKGKATVTNIYVGEDAKNAEEAKSQYTKVVFDTQGEFTIVITGENLEQSGEDLFTITNMTTASKDKEGWTFDTTDGIVYYPVTGAATKATKVIKLTSSSASSPVLDERYTVGPKDGKNLSTVDIIDKTVDIESNGVLSVNGNIYPGGAVHAEYVPKEGSVLKKDAEFTYQWFRVADTESEWGSDAAIDGANEEYYAITDDDLGYYLGVEVGIKGYKFSYDYAISESVVAANTGGGGSGGATPTTTPQPTTTPEPTGTPEPVVIPDPAEDVDPTADPSATKTASGEATVTEKDGVKTTEQTNTDRSTTKVVEDSNTGTKTTTVTEADGTVKEQSTTMNPSTGYVTDSARTVEPDGDFVQKTIEKDPTGNVVKEETASKTTDDTTKAVTETSKVKDATGTVESTKTTQANGDYTEVVQTLDATGKLVEQTSASKTTQTNGDFTEKSETKDAAGNVIESSESSKTTATDGSVTEKQAAQNKDGSAASKEVKKDATGTVQTIKDETTSTAGVKESKEYSGVSGSNVALSGGTVSGDTLDVPETVTGLGNDAYAVTEIAEGAFEDVAVGTINLPASITKVNKDAFNGSGATELNIAGTVKKGMFQKNALKDNGTGKKGKGLKIYVASKKDMKQMKKQLKKAGVPKAKVKIDK